MIKLPDTLKNYNIYVDGLGYAGRVQSGSIGEIKLLTEDFLGGGMGGKAKIDMGALDEVSIEITIAGTDDELSKIFASRDKDIIFRGAYGPRGDVKASVITSRGLAHGLGGFGNIDRSNKGEIKLMTTADYLKWTINDVLQLEYSIIPPILDPGDGNIFESYNAAIGL